MRKTLRLIHLSLIAFFVLSTVIIVVITGDPGENFRLYRNYFLWMDLFMILYLPKLFLLFTLSPMLLFRFGRRPGSINVTKNKTHIQLKYWWIAVSFFVTLFVLFLTLNGIIRETSRFIIKRVELRSSHVPPGFDGYKIAQFSDIHLGSWYHKENVLEGLKMIQSLNADIIVFTGDLINVNALETQGYEDAFRSLSALGGKYAIIGNHDLGDFARIGRGRNLGSQLGALSTFFSDQGFNLLRNKHLTIRKSNDSIVIAGVDNWSAQHFVRFGDLHKALDGIKGNPFTILLSHDPSHWKAEVLPKTTVDLTLSGHTHGGQLGFHFLGYTWSPIQLRYPEWNGLYSEAKRFLYVNPGMGFVGFSGRIGMLPEITLITLHNK